MSVTGIIRFPNDDKIVKDNSTPPQPETGKHWLLRLGGIPVRRTLVWTGRILAAVFALWLLILVALVLAWQFWLKPNLPTVRDDLAREASRLIGRQVSIKGLATQWQALTPTVTLSGFTIANPVGHPLSLEQVTLTPSWSSLWQGSLRFSQIRVSGVKLSLLRQSNGHILLNGFDLSQGDSSHSDGELVNWLLTQPEIAINRTELRWRDELVDVAPLTIKDANLALNRGLFGHRLVLDGRPDSRFLGSFRVSADWRGDDVNAWRSWQGKATMMARGGAFAWWERYAPKTALLPKGKANFNAELTFSGGHIDTLEAEGLVEQAELAERAATPLALPRIAGRVKYQREGDDNNRLFADKLFLQTQKGALFSDSRIEASWSDQGGGKVSVSRTDLAPLLPILIAAGLMPEKPWREAALHGVLNDVSASWQGRVEKPSGLHVSGEFDNLGWHTFGAFPGVAGGFAGKVALSEAGGELTLNGKGVKIDAPELFAYPWQLKQAKGTLTWARTAKGFWQVTLPGFDLATEDFSGQVDGTLQIHPDGALLADLKAAVPEVPLVRVVRYLPDSLGKETLSWLQTSLSAGTGREVKAVLKGDLRAFPFPYGKGGSFDLDARLKQAALRFAPDWPEISAINGKLVLSNDGVRVTADDAVTQGARLSQVKVELKDLYSVPAAVDIDGQVSAPLQTMLDYSKASPVNGYLDGFLSDIKAGGPASLGLKIRVPLDTPAKTSVAGKLAFNGNPLRFTSLPIPALDTVNGTLLFSEYGASTPGLALSVLGQRMRLQGDTSKQGLSRFNLQGDADIRRVLDFYLPVLAPFARGVTPLDIAFSLQHGDFLGLQANSSLTGAALQAPAPAHKTTLERWPLSLVLKPGPQGKGAQIDWMLTGHASGRAVLTRDGNLQTASVGVGTKAPALPAQGLALALSAAQLDADQWLAALAGPQASSGAASAHMPPWPLFFSLSTPQLTLAGRPWGEVALNGQANGKMARASVQNRYLAGSASYLPDARTVNAQLGYLKLPLPEAVPAPFSTLAAPQANSTPRGMHINLDAASLQYRARDLGRLTAEINSGKGFWQLDKVALTSVDGSLQISGVDALGGSRTAIRLAFNSGNLGAFLGRFGFPGAILGGSGSLSGALSWPGMLTQFNEETISGSLSLDVKDGRFASVDSQAARLLSVLSLQSVGRLLQLDFASVFGKGFAFDRIHGNVAVINGIFESSAINLDSTAAKVLLSGQVDLPRDSQSLEVTVTPKLSQGVALAAGAVMLNPVVGLATLAAETVLGNPIGRLFSFSYSVKGSLNDPVVKRVQTPLRKPNAPNPNP
ncbi:TIGR02099 family protein [Neisseriaceae bacterium B2N2-7]|uniref:TIGR02099 family protein n=1 Tax=Craterilacuibacter sinensis TaxID=2686017 RepID=A0A845BMF7_9NEIS|nr:TIGR02099 family protein [Craterilacuibacter sinensis]